MIKAVLKSFACILLLFLVLIVLLFAMPILYLFKKVEKCPYCKKRGKISYKEKYHRTYIPICQNCLNFKDKNVRRRVIIDDIID